MAKHCLFRCAEWSRQARTLMAWPDTATFDTILDSLPGATKDVCNIAEAIARFQPVTVVVGKNRVQEAKAWSSKVQQKHAITIHPFESDEMDLWMRDFAPIFVVKEAENQKKKLCGIDFRFNGWGNKFPTAATVVTAKTLLKDMDIEVVESSIVTEGGAIDVDGEGTLLATESSIINDNRNPGMGKEDIEAELKRLLGLDKVLWIPGRKGLDVTDCHIDTLARFVRPGTVLLSRPTPSAEPVFHEIYNEAKEMLARETDARGRSLEVVEVEEASLQGIGSDAPALEVLYQPGTRPALNYANYLWVNGGVILPQYGDEQTDANARDIFAKLFPDREVVPVHISAICFVGGVIHCSTQEIPDVEA